MADEDLELKMKFDLELSKLEKGLNEAGKEVEKFQGKVTSEVNTIDKNMSNMEKNLAGISKFMSYGGIIAGAIAAFEGIKRVIGGMMDFRNAADDSQDTVDALNLQLKNMGMYTDETSQKIQDFAEELQATTNFSNEDILGADTLLLTFRNISKDILPEATERLLDMSAVMGQDLKSSSIQLGKALSDPVEGISALSRVGITFTEQQKESIKKFVEQNDIMSAQKIILDELSTEFGGHAKLQVDAVEQSKNAWQSFKEVLGVKLQPAVDSLFAGFSGLIGIMTEAFRQTEVEKVTEDIEGQRVEVQILQNEFEALATKTNRTKEEQGKLEKVISELQKIYPDFLKNVDAQKIGYDDMTTALSGLNKQMERKFVYMAAEAEISDKMKEYAKYQKKVVENEDKLAEAIAKRQLKEKELLGMTTEEAKKTGKMGEFSEKKEKLLTGDLFQLGREYENENTWKKYLERDKTAAKKYLGEVEKIKEDYNDVLKEFGSAEEIVTGNGVTGNGTGDDTKTKYSLNTSESAEVQKTKLKNELAEKQKNADEWEKQINVIETEKAIAEIDAKSKYDSKIKGYEKELEKNNTAENKKRLDAKVMVAQNELEKSIATITSTSNDKIKAVEDAKKAEAEAEKKAEEKYKQEAEDREIARARAREEQRERAEQYRNNSPEKKLERGEAYASNVVGLSDMGVNFAGTAVRDKLIEEMQNYNNAKQKIMDGELLYKNKYLKELAQADRTELELLRAKIATGKQLEKDKEDFKIKLNETDESLKNKLISGEVKGMKQIKELGKQKLKEFMINKGQEHGTIALSEGGLMLAELAAQNYPKAAAHGLAAAENAAIATALGTAANGIKPSTSPELDNKQDKSVPGSTVTATKKKELVINTDNQQVVRMLLPELAQALDDGYSISKK